MAVARVKCGEPGCDWWVAACLSEEQIAGRLEAHRLLAHPGPPPPLFSVEQAPCTLGTCRSARACFDARRCLREHERIGAEVAAMADGKTVRQLASNPEARIAFTFTGTPAEFRAWCRAYVDGAGK